MHLGIGITSVEFLEVSQIESRALHMPSLSYALCPEITCRLSLEISWTDGSGVDQVKSEVDTLGKLGELSFY